MGFVKALQRLGKAAVGTVLLPIDVVFDVFDTDISHPDMFHRTERRAARIGRHVQRALEEIDE